MGISATGEQMENTKDESPRTRSKQDEYEHPSKQDEKECIEQRRSLIDLKVACQRSTKPETPDANHQRMLRAFIKCNKTAKKNLNMVHDKLKDGLIEKLEIGCLYKSVQNASSYICDVKNKIADTKDTIQFFMDLDAKSDLKGVLKELLIDYHGSLTDFLQLQHKFLQTIESRNAEVLNAKDPLNVKINASHKKIKKYVDELQLSVCSLGKALDLQHPAVPIDEYPPRVSRELPIDIIREEIYRVLPASDVLCARLINRNWYTAYASGSLGQIQAACGGSIPLGFLFATDKLQRRASAGLRTRHHFKGLDESYPLRGARVIASCSGFYLIHMRNPEELAILNPAVGQSQVIYPPVSIEESAYTGLAVSFASNSQVATSYCVAVPYRPTFINAMAQNPRIRFRIWNSVEGGWRVNPSAIDIEDFSPRNVVTVGQIIYFHISRDELVFYNIGTDQPGSLNMPLEVAGIIEVALCSYQGALGILSYDMVDDNIEIYTFEDNGWIHKENINMRMIVKLNRFAFRSLSVSLRSRDSEEPSEALLDIQLVGYVDPGWLLIRQKNGWILINLLEKAARRVRLGDVQNVFFGCRMSSFLCLS